MDKRLYVREGDLEVEAKRLEVPVNIYQQGPIRYEFPEIALSSLIVEERKQGNVNEGTIMYLHANKLLMPSTNVKNPGVLAPNGQFTKNFTHLFMSLLHGEHYFDALRGSTVITLNDFAKIDRRNIVNPYTFYDGELCQAIERYLNEKTLPEGMVLHKIPSWLDEPEDPFAYSLHIDLTK